MGRYVVWNSSVGGHGVGTSSVGRYGIWNSSVGRYVVWNSSAGGLGVVTSSVGGYGIWNRLVNIEIEGCEHTLERQTDRDKQTQRETGTVRQKDR